MSVEVVHPYVGKIKNLVEALDDPQDKIDFLEQFKEDIAEFHPIQQPVGVVMWVEIDRVQANDYNPNSVAGAEMKLLYTSIKHDGYTQPVVTIYDEELDKFVIVDGFHRYFTCKSNQDIRDRNHGRLPIVVIEKDINERMAATVRHNRARGSHSVDGMASMVFSMLEQGWSDADICNHLGMEPEELLRLKHITGFSKLFENTEYKKEWVTKQQILIKKKFNEEQAL
jgi:ParB-like chromosome segregation protein Spo0J